MRIPGEFVNTIIYEGDNVLLQFRTPDSTKTIVYSNHHSLWGGELQKTESILEGAAREVYEELRFSVKPEQLQNRGRYDIPVDISTNDPIAQQLAQDGFSHWRNWICAVKTDLSAILSQFPESEYGYKVSEGHAQIYDIHNLPQPMMSAYGNIIKDVLLDEPYEINIPTTANHSPLVD